LLLLTQRVDGGTTGDVEASREGWRADGRESEVRHLWGKITGALGNPLAGDRRRSGTPTMTKRGRDEKFHDEREKRVSGEVRAARYWLLGA
jgi:hypothetical protein